VSELCHRHLADLAKTLSSLDGQLARLESWGELLFDRLVAGQRLLAVGNGGSAAQAQHLTAELVGRYRHERVPMSAIALHAETSSVTAIANDYGYEEVFARQVQAHGRPGDIVLALSTSGHSPNVVAALDAGRASGLTCLAVTGASPNPSASAAHDAVCVDSSDSATVQEVHLVVVHLLCELVDVHLGVGQLERAW
jgi:phosphoheptose isomerase